MATSTAEPTYEQRQGQERKRNGAQHMQQPSEGRRTSLVGPVSLVHNELTPSRVPGRPQREMALIVSHRQTDWRREHDRPHHEQRVTRSPVELRKEISAQTPRREETLTQKPERSRGIRYSR